jgi:hypothetical protein
MHSVAIKQNGVDLGTIQFRGIKIPVDTAEKTRRHYKCNPKHCVPKEVARKIADRLALGVTAGYEKEFEWRS